MYGAPIKIGTKMLTKQQIKIGMTIKKIITNACVVTIVLYNKRLPPKYLLPGWANYKRITADSAVTRTQHEPPNIKYKTTIYLWLVAYNHRELKFRQLLTNLR